MLCCWVNFLYAQGPTNPVDTVNNFQSTVGFVDRIGAVAILALLIWKSPQIFAVTNQGKVEIAKMMKEAQAESYTKYLDIVALTNKEFNQRINTISDELKQLGLMSERSIGQQLELTKGIHELIGKMK